MDVLVRFAHPPVGMTSLMTWTEATGQRPGDLGIYEQHQRRIRIVARQPVRDAAIDLAAGAIAAGHRAHPHDLATSHVVRVTCFTYIS